MLFLPVPTCALYFFLSRSSSLKKPLDFETEPEAVPFSSTSFFSFLVVHSSFWRRIPPLGLFAILPLPVRLFATSLRECFPDISPTLVPQALVPRPGSTNLVVG